MENARSQQDSAIGSQTNDPPGPTLPTIQKAAQSNSNNSDQGTTTTTDIPPVANTNEVTQSRPTEGEEEVTASQDAQASGRGEVAAKLATPCLRKETPAKYTSNTMAQSTPSN